MTQPSFDLKTAFMPVFRSTEDEFWIGLGVIAALDAVRISFSPAAGLLSWLVIAFFVSTVFINRYRTLGKPAFLALGVLAGATVVKMLTGLFAMAIRAYPQFVAFLEDQGVNMNDPAAVQAAASDPVIQQAYQNRLSSDPEFAMAILQSGAWPSVWGFWLVLAAVGYWTARR
ncbi:hypothetical protein [Oceanicaulis sp. MMSF_3324]|uniref:hypothetical protein n=1 Tax=Oceanicaulis sp. MMSF_3324 TaxID=3046702 RepID=UPI00273E18CD|nr:hypothetical protein [Oceanicaulis sp. MMSF_3324]